MSVQTFYWIDHADHAELDWDFGYHTLKKCKNVKLCFFRHYIRILVLKFESNIWCTVKTRKCEYRNYVILSIVQSIIRILALKFEDNPICDVLWEPENCTIGRRLVGSRYDFL